MNTSRFQIIFLAVCVVLALGGVIGFSLYRSKQSSNQLPTITIWGTLSADDIDQYVAKLNSTLAQPVSVAYVQQSESQFNQNLLEAIASGRGPDMVLLPQDMLLKSESKFMVIPYQNFPQRTFLDTYVDEAKLYLTPTGTIGIPFSIDPLVMYWNKDTFTNAGIASAGTAGRPIYWAAFNNLVSRLTQKDASGNIFKSAVALGSFSNVDNAKAIYSTLLLQAGNPITTVANGSLVSALGNGQYNGLESSSAATSFFVQFANPVSANYSWNSSLPSSQSFFLAGKLATYFGFASELTNLKNKNPNLNFDVAPMPQAQNAAVRKEYARMYAFSLVRASASAGANASTAFTVATTLTSPQALALWSSMTHLPSVRRDMLGLDTTDPYMAIFDDASLIGSGWIDPDANTTNAIFGQAIDSIVSGTASQSSALQHASDLLDASIRSTQ